MNNVVIEVKNLSKRYHLGCVGTGTLAHDLNRWWAGIRGKPDPTTKIGNDATGIQPAAEDAEHVWALRGVSFEVERGEALGIIGANGAGKSTLLKILSRVTAPTKGEIRVRGRIASLLEVGTGFHPDLTGRENIFLNGAILGMSKVELQRKLGDIVDFAEVDKYIDTPVKRYSSGMYVRLAFAVAAHLEAEILVVDEVLAVGDVSFQKKCLDKMRDVSEHGRTVLFVSHNMAAIKQLCPRALLLQRGGISEDGESEHVVNRYFQMNRSKETGQRGRHQNEFNITIKHVAVLDARGEKRATFEPGEHLAIRYHIDNGDRPRSVALFASVEDETSRRLFASYSAQEGRYFDLALGTNTVDFVVPILPLNEGTYSVTVTMHLDEPNVCIDRIDRVRYFDVRRRGRDEVEGFFNTNLGPFTVNHEWSVPSAEYLEQSP